MKKVEQHEHEFFLDRESRVHGCECGIVEIGGKEYYPLEQVEKLRAEIERLKRQLHEIEDDKSDGTNSYYVDPELGPRSGWSV